MYIEPNTTIKLYSGVPLDNTYEHTLYFASLSAQTAYFHGGIAKYTLANNSYQRVERGRMRIEKKADDLYDCNYLAFQNSNYGNKWFYAFITGVEYVNNVTSEVTFEVDSMQTYMFDVTLKDCFVEREHSLTDDIGDNIMPEPLDIGNLVCNAMATSGFFNEYDAVIATAYDLVGGGANPTGGYYGGLLSGVDYIPCKINDPTEVANFIQALKDISDADKTDSVVSIFLMPRDFLPTNTDPDLPRVQVKVVAKATTIGNYTPKNKKLLTYPYNYLGVDCGNNSAIYRYEWFDDANCNFMMESAISANPQIMLVPMNYNGTHNGDFNYVEKLVMENFPQIAWSYTSYGQWLATEYTKTAMSIMGSMGAIGVGIATENPAAISVGAMGVASSINNAVIAENRPPQARGSNSGTIDVSSRTKDFYFRQMQVTEQSARMIDDFFTMFGYVCGRVKQPNISSRPHWNYVKTKGCIAVGSAPSDEIRKICSIYDKGITFWKSASEVGNYSLNNAPT